MFNRIIAEKRYELEKNLNNRNIALVILIVIIVNIGNHYFFNIIWTMFSTILQVVAVVLSLNYVNHKLGEATFNAVASIEAKGYKRYKE